MDPGPELSIVVPVHDRPASLRRFHERLVATWSPDLPPAEVVYVDDGSTDDTWAAVRDLPAGPFVVRGLRLDRNHGQTVAMWTGWRDARGSWLASLDADLEVDPSCLAELWQSARSGHDPVLAVRDVRHVPPARRLGSGIWNRVTRLTFRIDQQDLWCAALLMSRQLFTAIAGDGAHHRQFKLLLLARAASPAQVVVPAAPDDSEGYSVRALAAIGWSTYAELARLPVAFLAAPVLIGCGLVAALLGRPRAGLGLVAGGVASGAVGVLAGGRDLGRLPPSTLPVAGVVDRCERAADPSLGGEAVSPAGG